MTDLTGHRVALYVRVSTEEQARHGESIIDQTQALEQWVQDHGCLVAGKFVDEGFSARKPYRSRPALCALLETVEAGAADAVIFTKLDRWFRNVRDYSKVQEVLERKGVFWLATLEDYETRTSAGRFKVNLMLSLAEHEADQTSERIKFTFAQKRARGEIISGNMPKGYKLEGGKPVKDPATSAGVAAFWEAYLSGAGRAAAIMAATEKGLPMASSSATHMLRKADRYAGLIQGCKCEPYITEEQRDWVLATRKKAPRKSGHIYLFSGLIYCAECGGRMGGHRNIVRRKGKEWIQVYYNCSRHYNTVPSKCPSHVNIYERDVAAAILEELEDEMERCAAAAELAARSGAKARREEAAAKLERLEAKRQRCIEMYIDGLLSKEELQKRLAAVNSTTVELQKAVQDAGTEKAPEDIRAMLPPGWREIYEGLDQQHRRNFWFRVLDRIEIAADRKVHFSLRL